MNVRRPDGTGGGCWGLVSRATRETSCKHPPRLHCLTCQIHAPAEDQARDLATWTIACPDCGGTLRLDPRADCLRQCQECRAVWVIERVRRR
jgi:hypothetical protein